MCIDQTPLSNLQVPENDIDMGGNNFINLSEPTQNDNAATKLYVDNQVGSIQLDEIKTLTGNNSVKVNDTGNITNFKNNNVIGMSVNASSLKLVNVNMDANNKFINNVPIPINSDQAVNK